MKQDVAVFLGILLITSYLKHNEASPIESNAKSADDANNNNDSRKSNPNIIAKSGLSTAGKLDIMDRIPVLGRNSEQNLPVTEGFRARRSSNGFKQQPPRSAELETIMSGNWQGMDPASLYHLLTSLSSSRESAPQQEEFYGYDEDDDEAPIDLVYSGKKPLESTVPLIGSLSVAQPLSEPISLMSSNMRKVYKVTDDVEEDPKPIHLHRLAKKSGFPFSIFSKRSQQRRNNWLISDNPSYGKFRRDLVQLPNGEITFTPHGLHVLKYHQPTAFSFDDNLPVIRRQIL